MPRLRRWTRLEYERLVDLGMFRSGERLELLDGMLAVREPQGSRHAAAIRRVVDVLRAAFGKAWHVDSQMPFALDADSEPEPDIAVVPRDRHHYRRGHPSRAVLIVEIADSSYRVDRSFKASLYARAGIAEYWVVDLARRRLEVYRAPEAAAAAGRGWHYGSVTRLRGRATVTPLSAPGVTIRVADLLP
jgi:Uma2 family endonuclease